MLVHGYPVGMTATPPAHRPLWRRLVRALVALVVVTLVAAAGVGLFASRVVYHPHYDAVPEQPVDALFVIGPLDKWRVEYAEQLMREGRAHNLVLSTPNMPWDALYCEEDHGWPSYCFPPDPSTTRGEAQGLRRLAQEHGWTSFAVVTVDFHAARTRFIFERCLDQSVPVLGRHVPQPDELLRYQTAYQLGAWAKEYALGSC